MGERWVFLFPRCTHGALGAQPQPRAGNVDLARAATIIAPRQRSTNDRFDIVMMCSRLEPFARQKGCHFDRELATCSKTRRPPGPDPVGLVRYGELLRVLRGFAIGRYPSHSFLRETWAQWSRACRRMDVTSLREIWARAL